MQILAASLILAIGLAACSAAGTPSSPALDGYPWLFQRAGFEDGGTAVEIIAVGDILLGRGVREPEQAFGQAAPWLQAADLATGNLECALITDPITPTVTLDHSTPPPVRLYASPEAAGWLGEAGFDLLGLANNHALDGGPGGLAETAAHLQNAGLSTFGAGKDQPQALEPYLQTIKGVRLAFLGINAIPVPPETGAAAPAAEETLDIARWDRAAVEQAVQQARRQSDVVIVSIHWGYEYQQRVDPAQERLGKILLAAGADVIIGHHPHVIQPPEVTTAGDGRSRLVAYSLGNFVFDQGEGATGQGIALRLFVDRDGLAAAQALPVLAGSRPQLQNPEPEVAVAEPLTTAGFQCSPMDCAAVEVPGCDLDSGIFHEGRADLDGDGVLEEIQLEGGRITIQQGEAEAWASPQSWLVVDAALGDPDQDGRPDLVAIFWKADRAGVLRSHPFLIRSEGGRYQEVWGGSAVSEPILEVEVGDLDGDGLDELAILEQAGTGRQSLSVWRWHGWGFSQAWRSAPGTYQALNLAPRQACGLEGEGVVILAGIAK